MNKLYPLLLTTFVAFSSFSACDDTTSPSTDPDTKSSVDTLYISKTDTVFSTQKDTIFAVTKDTVFSIQKDTIFAVTKDTVFVNKQDSIFLSKTDTLYINSKDTVVIKDTILGLNGQGCNAEPLVNGNGYKIICGADSVGTIKNGLDAEPCTITWNLSTYDITCGYETITLPRYTCHGLDYDPQKYFCYNNTYLTLLCSGLSYDITSKFCQNGAIYDKCGSTTYDVSTEFCFNQTVQKKCNGIIYNTDIFACEDGLIHGTMKDPRDKKIYKTIYLNGLEWMTENLNYIDENFITSGGPRWNFETWCFNDDTTNCNRYGRLYSWKTVNKVCPEGWRLPTPSEGRSLERKKDFVNLTGLLGGSLLDNDNTFRKLNECAFYWLKSQDDDGEWIEYQTKPSLEYCTDDTYGPYVTSRYNKEGLSIRCVRSID